MTLSQNGFSAVVLSGGGAHGAYEVGVLKALMTGASWTTGNRSLAPDVLTGTSIGAYNAVVVTDRLETDSPADAVRYLEEVWRTTIPQDGTGGHNHIYRFRGNPADLCGAEPLLRNPAACLVGLGRDAAFYAQDATVRLRNLFTGSGNFTERSLELVDLSVLISRDPTERLLRKTIRPGHLRRSPRELFLAATNWQSGGVEYFQNADMTDVNAAAAVLASSALPGIFPPVRVNGKVYVDGGLALNTPLLPAFVQSRHRPDTAHVIYLDPEAADIPLRPLQSTIGTLDRLITVGLAHAVEAEMRVAHRVNRGLQLVEKLQRREQVAAADLPALVRSGSYLFDGIAGAFPGSPKTIHRYRPSRYLGGVMSLLNFSAPRVAELIDLGYQDTLAHDCRRSKCVLPDGMQGDDP